ncbi:hypothetical protein [Marinobacter sp. 2_MG-2023]|uniref:hypothetical protein n=1 Tax=Marinobacter sp. 2_MG-2023 TaxID=3062679 RepID=UPI0026E2C800|nr:hypothetical protein [Marinobacter sp. 2_MG-2023]MDO6441724.1 hypothetical protein [Marinobacter sp. 2_MG-2023]
MHVKKLAPFSITPLKTSVLLASAMFLSACGGSSSSSDDAHTDTDIDTAGRLALFDTGEPSALKILDLDSGDVLSSFEMTGEVPALYASPGNRYVVATQRGDDLVSFVDSGLYTEDHGDHMHDYAETPSLLSLTLNDHKPTHYTVGDSYGVVFFDGGEASSSKVTVFSDETLGSNSTLTSLDLETNMHGVAMMADGHLFVTYRDSSITGTTLPTMVERYHLDGGSFEFEERYSETCPALHGAAVGAHSLGFGCSDGVLVIDLHEAGYPTIKLANPASLVEGERIGTLLGNHDVEELVGLAGDQMFVIDPESESQVYLELELGDGVGPLVQGFTTHGEVFYVLGDDGGLQLFAPSNDWALIGRVQVMDAPGEDDGSPSIALSSAQDRMFVLTPDGQSVIEIDTDHGETVRTIDLGFNASGIAWVGLAEAGHDHDDEEHSH